MMNEQEIICALEEEGFSLLKRSGPSPEDIILSTILQEEPRLLLGIPLLINNRHDLDFDKLSKMAKSKNILPQLGYILDISAIIIKKHNRQNQIHKKISTFLKDIKKSKNPTTFNPEYSDIATKLKKPDDPLMLKWNIYMATRLSEFENHFLVYNKMRVDRLRHERTLDILEAKEQNTMKTLFTENQIEIINKRILNEKLTKTEREYYSRTIKKRLIAIQYVAKNSQILEAIT